MNELRERDSVSRKFSKALTYPGAEEEAGRMSSGDRREQLIRVAMHLFSQKGFRGTTTKEIALAAGVTEAIIFRHFASKDDLYAAILDFKASEVCIEDWLEEPRAYAERRDDEGLFRTLASKILDHYRSDLDFMRLMLYSALEGHDLAQNFREKQFTPIHDFLRDYIATRQREGGFRPCNPGAAVCAFIGMPVYHSLVNRLLECKVLHISDEEAIEAFTKLFLDGLRSSAPERDTTESDAELGTRGRDYEASI
jgi:TetR/AcrR family transcriptional regulator